MSDPQTRKWWKVHSALGCGIDAYQCKLGGDNTIVYVITHVFQGVLTDVRTFLKEEEADKYQEKLWKDNGIPVNEAEREKYCEENEVDDDIQKWKTEAQ